MKPVLINYCYGRYSYAINFMQDIRLRGRGSLLCKRFPPGHALRVEVRPFAQADSSLASTRSIIIVSRGMVD